MHCAQRHMWMRPELLLKREDCLKQVGERSLPPARSRGRQEQLERVRVVILEVMSKCLAGISGTSEEGRSPW